MSRAGVGARRSGSQPPSEDEEVVIPPQRPAGPSASEFEELRSKVDSQSALMQRIAEQLERDSGRLLQQTALPPSPREGVTLFGQQVGAPPQPLLQEGLQGDWRVRMARNEAEAKARLAQYQEKTEAAAVQPGQKGAPTWDLARKIIVDLANDLDAPEQDRLDAQRWLDAAARYEYLAPDVQRYTNKSSVCEAHQTSPFISRNKVPHTRNQIPRRTNGGLSIDRSPAGVCHRDTRKPTLPTMSVRGLFVLSWLLIGCSRCCSRSTCGAAAALLLYVWR